MTGFLGLHIEKDKDINVEKVTIKGKDKDINVEKRL